MPRIYVRFSGLQQMGTDCGAIAKTVNTIESDFQRTVKALDWDIQSASGIRQTANRISERLERQASALKDYQKFINEAYDEYVKLDEYKKLDFIHAVDKVPSWINNGTASLFKFVFVGPEGKLEIDWGSIFKDILISKPHVLSNVLPMISPITGLIYLTSGIASGNAPSFFDYSRTSSSNAGGDWLGYEIDGAKVTAWGGKAYAEIQNEVGYADVKAYLGKTEAGVTSDFSFMESKYKNGAWTEEFLNAEIKAGVDVSILEVDGKAGIGSDMLGAEIKGEGSVGNAELSGKGEISIGEDGIELNAKGKAMVTAVEGEVKGTINILGLEITGKVGGYAGGLGVEGEIGIDTNEEGKKVFVAEGGFAALVGPSVGIEIGFNETGWNNFVDAITFWD